MEGSKSGTVGIGKDVYVNGSLEVKEVLESNWNGVRGGFLVWQVGEVLM